MWEGRALGGGLPFRRRANMAHVRQSWPDSGLGLQVKVLRTDLVVPSSEGGALGGGLGLAPDLELACHRQSKSADFSSCRGLLSCRGL